MPSITFIYKIGNSRVYYGKYVSENIFTESEELDLEIRPKLVECINTYRSGRNYRVLNMSEVKVGIISGSFTSEYVSPRDIKVFDFYYMFGKTYLNGRQVINPVSDNKQE